MSGSRPPPAPDAAGMRRRIFRGGEFTGRGVLQPYWLGAYAFIID